MNISVKRGENGYDVLTPQCVTFDLADIEVWVYFRVGNAAIRLVQGFPVFWEESGLADDQKAKADELAAKHRVDKLHELAGLDFSPSIGDRLNPFRELLKHREEVAEGGPHATPDTSFFTGTELEDWLEQRQQRKRKESRKPLEVSLDEWTNAACKLFDLLREQPSDRLELSALRGAIKSRRQVSGEPPAERGLRLVEQSQLEPFFSRSDTNCIQWGPLYYDLDLVNDSHFFVVGMPRMGKTTLLRLLFQSLYRQPAGHARFVIYDAQADLLPVIYPPAYFEVERTQEEIDSEFYLLNPLDERCTAWDIAQDALDAPADVAELLFSHEGDSPAERYFTRMCRNVALAAMEAIRLKANGRHWTFYDLLCALQMENLDSVLSTTQRGKNTYAKYFSGTNKASSEAFVSLANKTEHLLAVAYEWRKAKGPPLSLRAWAQGDSKSIVLMSHKMNATALNDINRILLGLLCRNLFSDDDHKPRTFLYLDEFEKLGRIDSIIDAAQQGASKRVNVAMCLHDIGLMQTAYGAETEGLLSMCGFFAFLKTEGPRTAKWASDYLGSLEKERLSRTTHFGQGEEEESKRYSETASRQTLPNVLPDEIKGLPTPKTSNQVTGYFVAPPHPRYRGCLSLKDLHSQKEGDSNDCDSLWPASPRVKKYIGPQGALTPPEDSFFTLYQLGFRKPGYQPPEEVLETCPEPQPKPVDQQPVPAKDLVMGGVTDIESVKPVDQPPVPAKDQAAAEKTAPKTNNIRKRTDVSFDFGLDD